MNLKFGVKKPWLIRVQIPGEKKKISDLDSTIIILSGLQRVRIQSCVSVDCNVTESNIHVVKRFKNDDSETIYLDLPKWDFRIHPNPNKTIAKISQILEICGLEFSIFFHFTIGDEHAYDHFRFFLELGTSLCFFGS